MGGGGGRVVVNNGWVDRNDSSDAYCCSRLLSPMRWIDDSLAPSAPKMDMSPSRI